MVPSAIREELERISRDRVSGATALVVRGIALLRQAVGDERQLRSVARQLCRAQPSMAGFRTAAALALSADDVKSDLHSLEERVRHSPAEIAAFATVAIRAASSTTDPLRIVTCSRSSAVEQTLLTLNAAGPIHVCCSESRPGLEGLALAERLGEAGVDVELYSDAGLSVAIPRAHALVVGADAVSVAGIINKVGTGALAALARASDVPVFVLAGREKILPARVYERLPIGEGPPSEIARDRPGISICNPYFERIRYAPGYRLVTDEGGFPYADALGGGLWTERAESVYMSVINAYNMLDSD